MQEDPHRFDAGQLHPEGDRPIAAEELTDPFRQGLLLIARATSKAELGWLRTTLAALAD
ncbi:hypothetical protein [Kitasatospora azatica]|uniref:hypothetical protein n=1 Tax=Kitasatospora azatica TaxID=58347 RepID=UPI0038990FDE